MKVVQVEEVQVVQEVVVQEVQVQADVPVQLGAFSVSSLWTFHGFSGLQPKPGSNPEPSPSHHPSVTMVTQVLW